MRKEGHSVRCVTIQSLKFLWMGTNNHQVRANVEVMARAAFRRFPRAEIHVRDADAVNVRLAAGKAVLHPAQEYGVEAPWFIVRIPRNSWETGPFVRSFAKEPVFTPRRRWPIEYSRILGDECRTGTQCVRDLLRVSHRQSI